MNLQANSLLIHLDGIMSVLLFIVFYTGDEVKSPCSEIGLFLRKEEGENGSPMSSLGGFRECPLPFML